MQGVDTVVDEGRRDALVTELAGAIERRNLTTPAILLLEANRPFSFMASQLLLIAEPILGLLFDHNRTREIALFFENRDNVELLLEQVEANR